MQRFDRRHRHRKLLSEDVFNFTTLMLVDFSMATRIYEKDGFWYKYTSMHEVVASVEKSKIPSTVNIILRLCEKKRLYLLQAPGSKSRVFIFPKQEVFRARSFKVVRVCRFPHPPPRVSQLLPFK